MSRVPTDAVTVHLVRHGQSTWNAAGRLQGQTIHPDLTALGRAQARAAAVQVRSRVTGPVALWSSDLVRATQTAAIVAQALRTPVEIDESLREQGLGALEGRLTRDLHAQPTAPGQDVADVRWGGGESVHDVWVRVGRFLRRELPDAPPHLVLVTHGDTMRVLRAWLLGGDYRRLDWATPMPNGAVFTVPGPGPGRTG